MAPLLIGLTGKKGSGKDAAAGFIAEWASSRGLTFKRRGFADKLKHSAALALGFNVSEPDAVVLMDSLKAAGEVSVFIPGQSLEMSITGREFLQKYGTEAHRDIFGTDFWVDALLPYGMDYVTVEGSNAKFTYPTDEPYWHSNFDEADICVVPDVRFDNEAQRIRDLGGEVWAIVRPELESSDLHASEAGVDFELVDTSILNDKSLSELQEAVFVEMSVGQKDKELI